MRATRNADDRRRKSPRRSGRTFHKHAMKRQLRLHCEPEKTRKTVLSYLLQNPIDSDKIWYILSWVNLSHRNVKVLFRWGGKRLHYFVENIFRTICTNFYKNRPSFVDDVKNILVRFSSSQLPFTYKTRKLNFTR